MSEELRSLCRWNFVAVRQQYKVAMSAHVRTCNCAFSWRFYNDTSAMICFLTQSCYPEPEATNPSAILIILSAWLRNNKYILYKSLV